MEDNKSLPIFGAILVAFLGIPVVMQAVRGGKPTQTAPGPAGAAPQSPAEPAKARPPLLNKNNLSGSEWEVVIIGFPV